mgnify:FL=1
MLTSLTSFANVGLHCGRITVEVGVARGEDSCFFIVGLGDTAVQESKQRVRMALRSSGERIPGGCVISVNLAPGDLRKIGPRYDLPIAIGLLLSLERLSLDEERLRTMAFLGELAFDGHLRHVSGVLPAAIACRKRGVRTLVVPSVNAPEAALIPGIEVIGAESLEELLAILKGEREPPRVDPPASKGPHSGASGAPAGRGEDAIDFRDIRGQEQAKRAMEIAAAGGHNILLCGAPGSGKTLLARAFPGILPPLTQEESIEVMQIYSVANLLPQGTPLLTRRPFRAVHHTASGVSIVGGGQIPGPGEISLAHRGVLFLDELAEFPAQVLEVLRQPLEDRTITITRAQGSVTFPADFIMVAAMNPPENGGGNALKIQRRISVPLLDRIDLKIDIRPVPIEDLGKRTSQNGNGSGEIRARVAQARERQRARFKGLPISTNKEMSVRHIDELCPLDAPSQKLLSQATQRLGLSARAYHRTIKVARTIADLAGEKDITAPHVAEALQYRQANDQ